MASRNIEELQIEASLHLSHVDPTTCVTKEDYDNNRKHILAAQRLLEEAKHATQSPGTRVEISQDIAETQKLYAELKASFADILIAQGDHPRAISLLNDAINLYKRQSHFTQAGALIKQVKKACDEFVRGLGAEIKQLQAPVSTISYDVSAKNNASRQTASSYGSQSSSSYGNLFKNFVVASSPLKPGDQSHSQQQQDQASPSLTAVAVKAG